MPGYPSVFVHVDGSRSVATRVKLAAQIAASQHCRLVGVCATFTPEPQWFYRMGDAAKYLQEDRERRLREHETLRKRFEATVGERPIPAEWRGEDGDPIVNTLKEVKEAGLIVAGQLDDTEPESFIAPQFLESIILESGRPVLVIPYGVSLDMVGTRVLVAWDGGRECARALHDALPLLAGSSVHLLHANATKHSLRQDAAPVGGAVRLMRDAGADVQTEYDPAASDTAIGDLILSRAADCGADLIVMGAYGHGRFRELVLGGVTKTILSSMTVPTLLAH
ncbi:universal stress protein [Cupriavidus pauculus]|uniref:universal stress protein n=1 Tax=Cupriavidus pauculus TaxID=82633 RepID=UPI0007846FF8|nr:universal stress protein [Cupriavidus pauculus]